MGRVVLPLTILIGGAIDDFGSVCPLLWLVKGREGLRGSDHIDGVRVVELISAAGDRLYILPECRGCWTCQGMRRRLAAEALAAAEASRVRSLYDRHGVVAAGRDLGAKAGFLSRRVRHAEVARCDSAMSQGAT